MSSDAGGAGALPLVSAPAPAPCGWAESPSRPTRSPRAGVELLPDAVIAPSAYLGAGGVLGRVREALSVSTHAAPVAIKPTVTTLRETSTAPAVSSFAPARRAASSYGTCSELHGDSGPPDADATQPHASLETCQPSMSAAPDAAAGVSDDDDDDLAPSLSVGREAALWRTLQAAGLDQPPNRGRNHPSRA